MLQEVQAALLPIVQTINAYLSDYILVGLLIAVGLWFSIKTRFVQIRCFGEGMGKVFGNLTLAGDKHDSSMASSLSCICSRSVIGRPSLFSVMFSYTKYLPEFLFF